MFAQHLDKAWNIQTISALIPQFRALQGDFRGPKKQKATHEVSPCHSHESGLEARLARNFLGLDALVDLFAVYGELFRRVNTDTDLVAFIDGKRSCRTT